MQTKTTSRAAFAATIARALSHPVRGELLTGLERAGRASPSQLSAVLTARLSLAAVSYHVQQLRALGLVKPAGTRPRRGAVEHFYELTSSGRRVCAFIDALPGDVGPAR